MNKQQTYSISFTYDPNINPYYKSNTKFNNKKVLVYNLDEHCNNLVLAKDAFLIEYFTDKNECILTPEIIINNMHLNDDDILHAYFETQQNARNTIQKHKSILSVVTLALIFVILAIMFSIIKINTMFIAVPLLLYFLFVMFPLKNYILKRSYKDFIKALKNKETDTNLIDNFNTVINKVETLDYMTQEQKNSTKKHFRQLIKIVTQL